METCPSKIQSKFHHRTRKEILKEVFKILKRNVGHQEESQIATTMTTKTSLQKKQTNMLQDNFIKWKLLQQIFTFLSQSKKCRLRKRRRQWKVQAVLVDPRKVPSIKNKWLILLMTSQFMTSRSLIKWLFL